MKRLIPFLLILALLLSACGGVSDPPDTTGSTSAGNQETPVKTETTPTSSASALDPNNAFTDRDLEGAYDESKSAVIELTGSSVTASANTVKVNGSTVTITTEGTYILTGTLNDGMIVVSTEKSDKIQLVLKDASITSATCAPIYITQADKVFLTLADGTENSLSNGGSFTQIDDNNIDAAIFSKEDLTINGNGSLTVTSPAGHGIVSKDSLTVTGGNIEVNAAYHGLCGKDDVCITNAALAITSGKDGIQADNDEDTAYGYVYIKDGSFVTGAQGDGISASGELRIDDGDFTITTGGGSENAQNQTSSGWGGFGGGPGGQGKPGRPGGQSGTPGGFSNASMVSTSEDSTSIKGLKATSNLTILGGNFQIDSADDAIHSNADLTINGGSFDIKTGDDGFHADGALTVTNGTISVGESYEGLEGLSIDITGGDIKLVCSDDGLNAAGGNDSSGFGGFRGGDMFGGHGGGTSDSYIRISGGTLFINASGDGIDSNGTLEISGGHITVSGPTQGDTAVLDYDISGTITGGTFIGTGSTMMAQSLSSTTQGVIAIRTGNQAAGTQITITDSKGNTLITYTPNLDFAILIVSSPEIISGDTYTVAIGSQTADITAN